MKMFLSYSENPEVILVDFNLVSDTSQYSSRLLYSFVPNKTSGQLFTI